MPVRALVLSLILLASCAASASAAPYRPGEVVVRLAPGADPTGFGAAAKEVVGPSSRVLRVPDVRRAVARLRKRRDVASAQPNYVASIAAYTPDDPGKAKAPGGWSRLQWNLLGEWGVNVQPAWDRLIELGRPGGRGVTVAVLDTGVAYANRGPYRRSPDLGRRAFVRGYDFVDDDSYPNDRNGHGTHVASTIAQRTGNGYGLAGIAYGVRIMPVRVLDEYGDGDAADIAQGIRFAAKRGVRLINLSFEFGKDEFGNRVTADQIPDILAAIRYAHRKGSLVVAAAGNEADGVVAYPARSGSAFSVGAITEHGCLADYANVGRGLDITAPGGGGDANIPEDPQHCRPIEEPGRDIYQVTFATTSINPVTGLPNPRKFAIPDGYQGTSMAAPHVTAVAALVLASGVLGEKPTVGALEQRLKTTSRDLGEPGPDPRYGHGLVDAAAAVGVAAPLR